MINSVITYLDIDHIKFEPQNVKDTKIFKKLVNENYSYTHFPLKIRSMVLLTVYYIFKDITT